MEKKYCVSYTNGATGYGWEEDFDRLEDFEYIINNERHHYTSAVTVYDNGIDAFIFWKDVLEYDPKIDLLKRHDRDMRTRTRSKIS